MSDDSPFILNDSRLFPRQSGGPVSIGLKTLAWFFNSASDVKKNSRKGIHFYSQNNGCKFKMDNLLKIRINMALPINP